MGGTTSELWQSWRRLSGRTILWSPGASTTSPRCMTFRAATMRLLITFAERRPSTEPASKGRARRARPARSRSRQAYVPSSCTTSKSPGPSYPGNHRAGERQCPRQAASGGSLNAFGPPWSSLSAQGLGHAVDDGLGSNPEDAGNVPTGAPRRKGSRRGVFHGHDGRSPAAVVLYIRRGMNGS